MDMGNSGRRPWLAWVSMALLISVCGALAVLQYRWIGEVTEGERTKLREALNARLDMLSRIFDNTIRNACYALIPSAEQVDRLGAQEAYQNRYASWRTGHPRMFQRIGLALPDSGSARLLLLNLDTGRFALAGWPAEWSAVRDRLYEPGPHHEGFGRERSETGTLFTFGRFGPGPEPGPGPGGGPPDRAHGPPESLLVEFDAHYLTHVLLPRLLAENLGEEYDARVVDSADSSVIYESSRVSATAEPWIPDGSVGLLEIRPGGPGGRGGPGGPRIARGAGPPAPPGGGPGRWRLQVRHRAGSLEALVARTRHKNLAISAALLLLILATVGALVRFSRQAQRLAELQMNFVAGISHEFRTPVTVIRTAAFNLRGKLAGRPDQVERYGALIQAESEKLTALVEQVLRFASTRAGYVIREREPVALGELIEDGMRSAFAAAEGAGLLKKQIDPALPPVMADRAALQQAVQNLVDNALKYGEDVGVSASAVNDGNGRAVEIRVSDHGPGIPADEQERIFDPFFRGRKAVRDQVHGTGLGLNLVKTIVEAHGGTIRVESEPMKGTEFIVRIPATETNG